MLFTKKQKRELLEKSKIFESLSLKQISILIYWESINSKKANKFYEMLQIGKSCRFAFEDAKNFYEK